MRKQTLENCFILDQTCINNKYKNRSQRRRDGKTNTRIIWDTIEGEPSITFEIIHPYVRNPSDASRTVLD